LFDNSSFSFLQHHLHLSEVTSTNDVAKQLAEENLVKHGYVITTDFQSVGRGQDLNGWEADKGKNILCSLILNPQLAIEYHLYLNLAISLGVYDFIVSHCPTVEVLIKWPNDIYVNQQKIAGILIENTIQGQWIKQCIVGIGININQEKFTNPKAVSLSTVVGQTFDIAESIKQLLAYLEVRYSQLLTGNYQMLWNQYHEVFYQKNRATTFESMDTQFEGIPKGIDHSGRLMVLVNNHIKTFNVKEITWK
jgi:BirA family transcriptional regulator, biotin operon repressor / biotin---[acetyl-CoA-carboxylase] ligase